MDNSSGASAPGPPAAPRPSACEPGGSPQIHTPVAGVRRSDLSSAPFSEASVPSSADAQWEKNSPATEIRYSSAHKFVGAAKFYVNAAPPAAVGAWPAWPGADCTPKMVASRARRRRASLSSPSDSASSTASGGSTADAEEEDVSPPPLALTDDDSGGEESDGSLAALLRPRAAGQRRRLRLRLRRNEGRRAGEVGETRRIGDDGGPRDEDRVGGAGGAGEAAAPRSRNGKFGFADSAACADFAGYGAFPSLAASPSFGAAATVRRPPVSLHEARVARGVTVAACVLLLIVSSVPPFLYAVVSGALDFGFTVGPLFATVGGVGSGDRLLRAACLLGQVPLLARALEKARVRPEYALIACLAVFGAAAQFVGMSPSRTWEVMIASPFASSAAALGVAAGASGLAAAALALAPRAQFPGSALSHAFLLWVLLAGPAAPGAPHTSTVFELFTPAAFAATWVGAALCILVVLAQKAARLGEKASGRAPEGGHWKSGATGAWAGGAAGGGAKRVPAPPDPLLDVPSDRAAAIARWRTVALAVLGCWTPWLLLSLPRLHVASRSPRHFADNYTTAAVAFSCGSFILAPALRAGAAAVDASPVAASLGLGALATLAHAAAATRLLGVAKLDALLATALPALYGAQEALVAGRMRRRPAAAARVAFRAKAAGIAAVLFLDLFVMGEGESFSSDLFHAASCAASVVALGASAALWLRLRRPADDRWATGRARGGSTERLAELLPAFNRPRRARAARDPEKGLRYSAGEDSPSEAARKRRRRGTSRFYGV